MRTCYRSTYLSQYEPTFERIITRAQNQRMKMGASGCMDEPFPAKPKYMRWNTYHRLEQKDDLAQAMFWAILRDFEMRIERGR